MSYMTAYPIVNGMGLRGEINALLEHVAYARHDFGYLPSLAHASNYSALLEDYSTLLVDNSGVLELAPVVKDSQELADLVDTLLSLANDYPVYDEEAYHSLEQERLLSEIEELRKPDDPDAEAIAHALYESGAYLEHSEYGVYISQDDWERAIAEARSVAHV